MLEDTTYIVGGKLLSRTTARTFASPYADILLEIQTTGCEFRSLNIGTNNNSFNSESALNKYVFNKSLIIDREPGSSVSTVSGYGLDDRTIEVRSPAEAKDFPVTSVSRPAQGPTQPPVQWVRGFFPGAKARLRRDADYSPPSSTEVENE
jgi:hypothetical protein